MKRKTLFNLLMAAGLALALAGGVLMARRTQAQGPLSPQAPLGTGFTYQGYLTDGSGPVDGTCDFEFALYGSAGGSDKVGNTQAVDDVEVSAGYFTVELNGGGEFGVTAFTGAARWLEIAVDCGGGSATLSPRVALNATPHALYAAAAPWGGLSGVPGGFADGVDNDTTYTAGSGLTLTGGQFRVNFAGSGSAATASRSDHNHDASYWKLAGNGGTTAGTNFLGTTDDEALELHVNGARALRLEPNGTSPNVIGGYGGNTVSAGVVGATISGGGAIFGVNVVYGDYGSVGGGNGNQAGDVLDWVTCATVGGGADNTASDYFSTVGGGQWNTASDWYATVGGGGHNTANGYISTVGGGHDNTASDWYATVGGGRGNTASGDYATVPGGFGAHASLYGQWAFASGTFYDVFFPISGTAQASFYVMRRETTGSGTWDLYLDGSSAYLTIPVSRTVTFDILVVGSTEDGYVAGYNIWGVVENDDGDIRLVGWNRYVLGEDAAVAASWDAQVAEDDLHGALAVQVVADGKTIRWVATVRTAEVAW